MGCCTMVLALVATVLSCTAKKEAEPQPVQKELVESVDTQTVVAIDSGALIIYTTDMKPDLGNMELYAEVGDRRVPTGITEAAQRVEVIDQGDYDGDGFSEAVVFEWAGGNTLDAPYIVYYDKETGTFKKAEGFVYDGRDDVPEMVVDEWKGKPSLLQFVGMRMDRYVYEDHAVKLVEHVKPDVGKKVSSVTMESVFSPILLDEGSCERTVDIDIDGDGKTEEVTFLLNESHMLNWGEEMLLMRISGAGIHVPADTTDHLGATGKKFVFLKSKTKGMPDILCDDAWLFQWDGQRYHCDFD